MNTFNFNNQESEKIIDSTISNSLENSIDKNEKTYEKKRYYVYVGNFGGLAGLNTTVYQFYNRYYDRYYVGQTVNLQARLNSHYQSLDKNIHKNKEFQKDYNEMVAKGLNHQQEIQGTLIFRKFYERINTVEEISDINKLLVKKESEEIARLVEKGEEVYNLYNFRGTPCLIKGRFHSSLENARQALGLAISTDQIKANLGNPNKPDWQFARDKDKMIIIPSTESTEERAIEFINPFTDQVVILPSISECERYLKGNFNNEQKKKFKKLGITTSRKRIKNTCSEGKCIYLKFAD